MKEQGVLDVAQKAEKLASSIKNPILRPVAFGVIFDRLLGLDEKLPIRELHSQKVHKATAVPARSKKAGPQSRLNELVEDGFFSKPRSLKAVLDELGDRGYGGYDAATIGKTLQRLVQDKVLRRKKVKEGNKSVYTYTNW